MIYFCIYFFRYRIINERPRNRVFWFTDVTAAVHTLTCSSEDDFKEGDDQAEAQPYVNHLHVRGGGQLLYLAGEDGGHPQHDAQVHSNGIAKEGFVKEDGDKGDEEQEDGREVGGQQLCGNLPLQLQGHVHHIAIFFLFQGQVCVVKKQN